MALFAFKCWYYSRIIAVCVSSLFTIIVFHRHTMLSSPPQNKTGKKYIKILLT